MSKNVSSQKRLREVAREERRQAKRARRENRRTAKLAINNGKDQEENANVISSASGDLKSSQ
jgi:hypothetical protein